MKRLFYLSFMATLVIGCQEFVSEMSPVKKAESFEAVTEDFSAKTKTSMDESRNVVWSKGDYIAVFQACSIADKYYVTESSAGKTNGTFKLANDNSGNINGDFSSGTEIETNIAVYPFAEGLSCTKTETESSVTAYRIEGFTLPEVQYYSANSFGEEAFPMVAVTESSADHKLKFKNVCGAIKLQLKGTGIVQSITIQGKNGEKLSGPATITAYPGGTPPTIAMDENASTSVTLDCGNGVQLNEATATEFIISVPPVVFSKGFTFSVNGLETDVENIVYRSSILVMPEVDIEDRNIGYIKADLCIITDKNVIKADGIDKSTFKVYYKGVDVTAEAHIYQKINNKYESVESSFSTSQAGDYVFQAAYVTGYSDVLEIIATDSPIPDAANDPNIHNTSFVHRTFFNSHTGAQCPHSPFITHLLNKTLTDDIKDKVVLAELRNYSGERGFASVPNPSSAWPYLHIDYDNSYPYNQSVEGLQNIIAERTSTPAVVGISANPVYYDNGQIIVKVAVKAAQTGNYNIGLWLMQDNYYRYQSVDESRISLLEDTWGDSYHYHHNCVRIAESSYTGSHIGYPLGVIEQGQTAEWTFCFNVNLGSEASSYTDSWWYGKKDGNLDDLHFAAFVTTHIDSRYTVVNAIDFPYNQTTPFDYL